MEPATYIQFEWETGKGAVNLPSPPGRPELDREYCKQVWPKQRRIDFLPPEDGRLVNNPYNVSDVARAALRAGRTPDATPAALLIPPPDMASQHEGRITRRCPALWAGYECTAAMYKPKGKSCWVLKAYHTCCTQPDASLPELWEPALEGLQVARDWRDALQQEGFANMSVEDFREWRLNLRASRDATMAGQVMYTLDNGVTVALQSQLERANLEAALNEARAGHGEAYLQHVALQPGQIPFWDVRRGGAEIVGGLYTSDLIETSIPIPLDAPQKWAVLPGPPGEGGLMGRVTEVDARRGIVKEVKHPRWLHKTEGGEYDHSDTFPKWQWAFAHMAHLDGEFHIKEIYKHGETFYFRTTLRSASAVAQRWEDVANPVRMMRDQAHPTGAHFDEWAATHYAAHPPSHLLLAQPLFPPAPPANDEEILKRGEQTFEALSVKLKSSTGDVFDDLANAIIKLAQPGGLDRAACCPQIAARVARLLQQPPPAAPEGGDPPGQPPPPPPSPGAPGAPPAPGGPPGPGAGPSGGGQPPAGAPGPGQLPTPFGGGSGGAASLDAPGAELEDEASDDTLLEMLASDPGGHVLHTAPSEPLQAAAAAAAAAAGSSACTSRLAATSSSKRPWAELTAAEAAAQRGTSLEPLDGAGLLPPARSLPLLPGALPAPPPPVAPAPPGDASAGSSQRQPASGKQPAKRQKAAAGAFDAPRLQLQPQQGKDVAKHRTLVDIKLQADWSGLQAIKADPAFASYARDVSKAASRVLGAPARRSQASTAAERPPPADASTVKDRHVYQLNRTCTAAGVKKFKDDSEVNRLVPLMKTAAQNVLKARGGSSYNPRRGAPEAAAE